LPPQPDEKSLAACARASDPWYGESFEDFPCPVCPAFFG
jgi:hypothetical protein